MNWMKASYRLLRYNDKLMIYNKQLTKFSSRNIINLKNRGMIQDIFPAKSVQDIVDLCNGSSQCVYAGFDPTAKSLHIGNLLVLTNLMHWQRGSHQVIALIGGATAQIGDPSGRNTERSEQESSELMNNSKAIVDMINQLFENHAKYFWKDPLPLKPVKIVDNFMWYGKMNVIEFIGTIGRKCRIGNMLTKTCVSSRLNSDAGISFSEFSYQLFQAYDWLHLLRKHNCRFQVGGNDQMGNIVSGYDLIGRFENDKVYGLTVPLIVNDLGDKYGKSAQNAVWLNPEMTSHFDLYQFLLRTPDSDVGRLLKLFTFRHPSDIDELVKAHMNHPEKRKAQQILADDVTLLIRGQEGLDAAKLATAALYGSDVNALAKLDHSNVSSVFAGASQVEMMLEPGITVRQLSLSAKCFLDQKSADRIISAGGFYINHKRACNPDEVLINGIHILSNLTTLIRVGKKNYYVVKWLT